MRTNRKNARSFEQLETRYALAGNVTATVDGSGNLLVGGDTLANGFILKEFSTGKFDLTGINAGGSGTTINGGAVNGTLRLNGVTGAITVRGGSGNDTIQIPYFNYGGRFIVNTGNGDDALTLGANAKASYLVGTLSIRTGEGKDTVTERNINIIGNQDLSATKLTDSAATATGNKQVFSVTNSTFGSFVYFNFGGREAKINLSNVITAGYVSILDPLIQKVATVQNGSPLYSTLKPIARSFEVNLDNVSIGAALTFTSSANTDLSITNSYITATASMQGIGAQNSYNITDSSFGDLYLVPKTSHPYNLLPSGIATKVFESLNDEVYLGNVAVADSLDLDSTGSIQLEGVSAKNVSLRAYDNEDAVIEANNSVFENLTIELGSTVDPNELGETANDSAATNQITATLFNSSVSGVLFLDLSSRVKIAKSTGPEGGGWDYEAWSRATATYNVQSSVVGYLSVAPPDGVNTRQLGNDMQGNPNPITYFNFSAGQFDNVAMTTYGADERVLFSGNLVKNSTYADGSAGIDSFTNSGSTLNALTKVNFES